MKLSMLPVSYYQDIITGKKSIASFAREGCALGLDAIDLSVLFFADCNDSALDNMQREVEAEGMNILEVVAYTDFTYPDPLERKKQTELFSQHLESAARVGARFVRITAGQAHPGLDRISGIGWAVEGIVNALPKAKELGIQLLFENHSKPGVWMYPDFNFPTENFLEVLSVLPEDIKVQFDSANPIVFGDDPLKILDKVINRVELVHAADTQVAGTLKPVVIGTGLAPFPDIFRALQTHGYDGWISIEEASGTGSEGIQRAIHYVRDIWEAMKF